MTCSFSPIDHGLPPQGGFDPLAHAAAGPAFNPTPGPPPKAVQGGDTGTGQFSSQAWDTSLMLDRLQRLSARALMEIGAEAATQCAELKPEQVCDPVFVSPEQLQMSEQNLANVAQIAAAMRAVMFQELDHDLEAEAADNLHEATIGHLTDLRLRRGRGAGGR